MTPAELNKLLRKYIDIKPINHAATKKLDSLLEQVGLLNLLDNSKEFKTCLAELSCLFEEGEAVDLQDLESILSSLLRTVNEKKG